MRLLSPAAQRVRFDPQLAAHLAAGRRHAGLLVLDQVQHQPDRPVTQLVRILPCCSHLPTLPWIGSLHKPRGDSATPSEATHPPRSSTDSRSSPSSAAPSPETPGYHPSRTSPELHPQPVTQSYTYVTQVPECLPEDNALASTPASRSA